MANDGAVRRLRHARFIAEGHGGQIAAVMMSGGSVTMMPGGVSGVRDRQGGRMLHRVGMCERSQRHRHHAHDAEQHGKHHVQNPR